MTSWVAGVDGCRKGWVVVLLKRRSGAHSARVVRDFPSVLALPEAPAVVAIDVPIGLLPAARAGGRECEVLARQLLGPRKSSVFSAPTRPALDAFRSRPDYWAVFAANRGPAPGAPGISRQTFGIMHKIDEVDHELVTRGQRRVVEVHPELCFYEANGGTPMRYSKKRSSGRNERVALLRGLGLASPLQLLGARIPNGAQADDLLDACIACWTAERVAAGGGLVIPEHPPTDQCGLRMELWR